MRGRFVNLLPAALLLIAKIGCAQSMPETNMDIVARGKYLTAAADCVACHSVAGHAEFAGGRAFNTPYGVIYSPNITADAQTGIGRWSDADFLRALHEGIGRRGEHLYPVFPYTQYTQLSDADVLAIKAYLFSLPAVAQANKPHDLRFPYNIRGLLSIWNVLNFSESRFEPDARRSAEYNRGKYLAEALGHCNECHTPRTRMRGLDRNRHLGGAVVDGWDAYNITPDEVSGIGSWSRDDIVTYLSTGYLDTRAHAAGPMAEVVTQSLRFLSAEDLRAVAAYLKEQPPLREQGATKSRYAYGQTDADRSTFNAPGWNANPVTGRALYAAACASCHTLAGAGLGGAEARGYPSLIGSSALGARSPDNLVLTILHGVQRGDAFMPAFGEDSIMSNALSDAQIALLSNYALRQFGNSQAATLNAADVHRLRSGGAEQGAFDVTWIIGIVAAAVVLSLAAMCALRSRRSDS